MAKLARPKPPLLTEELRPTLSVTRHDRVSSFLMAVIVLIGLAVLWMGALWASQVWGHTGKAVTVAIVEIPGGDPSGILGASLDVENASEQNVESPSDVQQVEDNLPEKQLTNWLDALAELPIDVVDPQERDEQGSGGPQGSSTGDSKLKSRGQGGIGSGLPREQRWMIYYDPGQTLGEYARMLDHFHIELGAVVDNRLIYVARLSDEKPRRRTASPAGDDRLRWLWRGGSRREADVRLLQKAGVDANDAIIMQFLPKEVEDQLAGLERRAAGGRAADSIERTAFRIRKTGDAYEFYVVEQSFF